MGLYFTYLLSPKSISPISMSACFFTKPPCKLPLILPHSPLRCFSSFTGQASLPWGFSLTGGGSTFGGKRNVGLVGFCATGGGLRLLADGFFGRDNVRVTVFGVCFRKARTCGLVMPFKD